jgi:cytochrome P450
MSTSIVETDIDIFSPEVVADVFPVLAELRESSPVVYLPKYDFYLLTRYDHVREATSDWKTFTSRHGVALRDDFNAFLEGSMLATDPPEHERLRGILSDKLAPRALRDVHRRVRGVADEIAGDTVRRGSFDGAEDVSAVYPITIVSDLVGLPVEGRERFHPGADANFAGMGPLTPYLQEHLDALITYQQWMGTMVDRSKLTPDGWGAAVLDAVDEGRIDHADAVSSLIAYMTAGMDTTTNAISAAFVHFAQRPEVWSAIRENPVLLRQALDEVLRLESPVTGFFRVATRDIEIGGVPIPAGARVMVHWAAANRDPRHYASPDEFILERNPVDHLAFGYGVHGCPGRGLAFVELTQLFEAYMPLVERFELVGPPVRSQNPMVRSLSSVPLTVAQV